MSKLITPPELAEIVTALLVAPHLLGELSEQSAFGNFLQDIAQVVANHCGGEVAYVSPGEHSGSASEEVGLMVAIEPNDSLPSIRKNVWTYHDPDAWNAEAVDGVEEGEAPSSVEIDKMRDRLRSLLAA